MGTYARKPCRTEIRGDHAVVFTKKGEEIKIDIEDIPLVQFYSWRVKTKKERVKKYGFSQKYAYTHVKTEGAGEPSGKGAGRGYASLAMHRLIAQTDSRLVTDHQNGDGLDNRRKNLRQLTSGENIRLGGGRKPRR